MPSKVAIYIRVSTQEQAMEGYSIGAQTERLSAYCKAKDWPIFHIYTDPGFSGSNMQRPALKQLFQDIEHQRIDCVLVYKLDRLSRSQKDTLYMIEDVFLKNDIAFVSMNENFDTSTPFGRAMIGILSVFAQLEREQIRERTRMGRTERAKSGLWHGGGWEPFGYNYKDGRLIVNQLERTIVHDVYDLFLQSVPITSIAHTMQERYGRKITTTLIHSILTTSLYTGVINWRGKSYPGQHEAIIDEVSFKRAQEFMHDRSRLAASKPNPFKSTTLLGGLLYCGHCGARYFSKGNYSGAIGGQRLYYPYYYCYSRGKTNSRLVLDPNCKNPTYAVQKLDQYIIEEIKKMANSKRYLNNIIEGNTSNMADSSERRTSIMQRIDEIETQRTRLIDLYQIGTISIDDVDERSSKLDDEQEALQHTLDAMESHKTEKLPRDRAIDLMNEFISIVDDAELDDKKALLGELIEKIIVKEHKGDFDIMWNF